MNFIINFMTKDIWRKLIALAIAFVLFLNLYEYKERDIHDVKVVISHEPDIFVDPSYQQPTVRVRIKGSKRQVDKLALQHDIAAHIKLESSAEMMRTGKARIYLKPQNFNGGRGVEIVSIEPEVIEFPIQRKITRSIAIKPDITGSPKAGKVCTISSYPQTVEVSGPEQLVKSLPNQISTETFAIDGDDTSFNKQLKLVNPSAESLQLSISYADVKVEIRDSYDITKDVSVAIKYLHPAKSSLKISADISKVTVRVKGKQEEINLFNRNNVTVFADISNITEPGEHTVPLRASLLRAGKSIQVESISPEKVNVTVPALKSGK